LAVDGILFGPAMSVLQFISGIASLRSLASRRSMSSDPNTASRLIECRCWVISGSEDRLDGLPRTLPVCPSERTCAGPHGWSRPWANKRHKTGLLGADPPGPARPQVRYFQAYEEMKRGRGTRHVSAQHVELEPAGGAGTNPSGTVSSIEQTL